MPAGYDTPAGYNDWSFTLPENSFIQNWPLCVSDSSLRVHFGGIL
jgi:hypothetical protein